MIEAISTKKTEDNPKTCIHIESKSLKRLIYAQEVASMDIDDLRILFHEMESDRDSMIHSVQGYTRKLAMPPGSTGDTPSYIEKKLAQINRKLSVYETFLKLIKQEISWRLAISNVSRAKLAIQAKEAGLSEDRVNTLLGSILDSEYNCSLVNSRTVNHSAALAAGIEDLKKAMVAEEIHAIMSREFDEAELQAIKQEAVQKVNSSFDWNNLGSIILRNLPGNGTFKL